MEQNNCRGVVVKVGTEKKAKLLGGRMGNSKKNMFPRIYALAHRKTGRINECEERNEEECKKNVEPRRPVFYWERQII